MKVPGEVAQCPLNMKGDLQGYGARMLRRLSSRYLVNLTAVVSNFPPSFVTGIDEELNHEQI
jgi:hypothetical protein